MDLTFWLELLLLATLLGLSGFFSSSETSLFSLTPLQLQQMRRDGNPRVPLIERMLSLPRRLIITILIGNELVNVTASVVSAALIIELLGASSKWLNLLVMVPLLLLVGEITPKTLAIRHNVAFASRQAGPIEAFAWLITPLRGVIRRVADSIITLLVGTERSRGNLITEDMVRTLAHVAVGEGTLDFQEAAYIDQIFDFGERTVEDVMTPRGGVFFLPVEAPIREIVEGIRRTRFSKIPIYRKSRDKIVGVLYARDLLALDLAELERRHERIRKLLRHPYFVPETKPASELFHAFRRRRISMALVVDEYGGVAGLVTMEDLLECIFGDIHSPSDAAAERPPETLPDRRIRVHGSMAVSRFNERYGSRLSDEEADTLAGILLNALGELPTPGAQIELGRIGFTVASVVDNRIEDILVELPAPASGEEDPAP